MLQTNLKHILSASEHQKFIGQNDNVMTCCGWMGPMKLFQIKRVATMIFLLALAALYFYSLIS